MYLLYGNQLSTYCAKVRAVLRHKQVAFEDLAPPDGYGSDAYRALIPMGTVPGLVGADIVLSESEAICEYLEESYPLPAMLPTSPTARAMARSYARIHDCWVEPQLRALYAHANPAARKSEAVTQHVNAFNRRLNEFAHYASPDPYLMGASLSIADCAWPTTLTQARLMFGALGETFAMPANLQPWLNALFAHPAIAPGIAQCELEMLAWFDRLAAKPAD